MPTLGTGPGQVAFNSPQDMRNFADATRKRGRMQIPQEPSPIKKLSEEQQVHIYNVSPWRFEQHMGSYGYFTIPALEESKVMDTAMSVAGPLTIDGLPKEYYPMGQALPTTLYHQPREMAGIESERPGYSFALEICGVGLQVAKYNDLRLQGVLISTFREPSRPEKGEKPDAWERFNKWSAMVKEAREALRRYCVKQCQEANMYHSQGNFAAIRGSDGNPKIYQCARIIKGTVLEYKWLGDTEDTVKSRACIVCSTAIKEDAMKCPQCGEKQMSDEKYKQELERRQALAG